MASSDREPSSSSSPPPPSAAIVPAESEAISASSSAAPAAAAGASSAAKKPAWNRPRMARSRRAPSSTPTPGPLSRSHQGSLKPSSSSDLAKISDGSASNPGPSVSTSSPRRNSTNANPNSTPNSSTLPDRDP
uniref:Uncharacterized protein n=1 Tax=Ananas comosus var. bracteatus TaxID=296719 RepID=A0A6V7NK80_ANACO|nr:unnamed protein product [Ananas comosus var. bracteatus]